MTDYGYLTRRGGDPARIADELSTARMFDAIAAVAALSRRGFVIESSGRGQASVRVVVNGDGMTPAEVIDLAK